MKNMNLLSITFVAVWGLFFESAIAAGPTLQWQTNLGGVRSNDDAKTVQQTFDGGYIIVGSTDYGLGLGYYDVYLIKTDPNGNSLWQNMFGGSSVDRAYSVQQTFDGGYIIAGWTNSFGAGWDDVYLVKADSAGNLLWQKTFGGSSRDIAFSVQQTFDGGYIIAGATESFGAGQCDVYLIKADSAGNFLWQRTFGGSSNDIGYSVQQTFDGGYIIAGMTDSFGAGQHDVYLIKTDSAGNLLWEKTFGGSSDDTGYSVQQTSDGGYIIAGDNDSFGAGWADVYLIKTDSAGNLLWQKTFGESGLETANSVRQTCNGGYIIAGQTDAFGAGGWNVLVIKTDPIGNFLWVGDYGGSEDDIAYSVQQTFDGGYIIAGKTNSFGETNDVYLVKLRGVPFIPGDLNEDGKVNFEDFAIFASHWLEGI